MRAIFMAMTACVGLSVPVVATADSVLVELYTSQGCSSCPPADEVLGQLAQRDDVIALSLHVDYWDYLGWKDVFSKPEFTKRQQAYALTAHSSMIYTPQMIVGGADSVIGTHAMELLDHITKHQNTRDLVEVNLTKAGGDIVLQATVDGSKTDTKVVQLVRYIPSQSVEIKRGENAGRTVTYHNVVTSWTVLGTWDGTEPLRMRAPLEGDAPAVVVIQDGASGPVLAVARLD